MTNSYFFNSDKLGFRKFNDSDLDPFFEINSDPEVMRYFPSVLNIEQTKSLMKKINNHIDEHGYGFFAVDLLPENSFIGFIGFKNTSFEADFTPCVEIGWRLHKKYWNLGLATEGALRCLKFARTDLSLNEIYSFTPLLNKASERVMQKIGMNKIGEFDHPLVQNKHKLKLHSLYKTSE